MCQIQTSFWSCGQLAEGRTIVCFTYQLTQGKCCNGYSSFSRMIFKVCPNCLAGQSHPQTQDLNASIDVKGHAVQNSVPNVVNDAITAPSSKNSMPPAKQQHQAAQEKKLAPKSVPNPARISAKGDIKKPAPPPTNSRSMRRLSPIAEAVTGTSSSPRRSPRTQVSRFSKMAGSRGSYEVSPSLSSTEALKFPLNPALIGV